LLQQSERLLETALQAKPLESRWHEELIVTRVALAGSKANPPGISLPDGTAHAAWRQRQLLRALPHVCQLATRGQQVFWTAEILDNLAERSLISEPAEFRQLQESLSGLQPSLLQVPDIQARLLLLSDTTLLTEEMTAVLADPHWVFPAGRMAVIRATIAARLQQMVLPVQNAARRAESASHPAHAIVLLQCSQWLLKMGQNSELVTEILHTELIRAVAERATTGVAANWLMLRTFSESMRTSVRLQSGSFPKTPMRCWL
jgi:hypothetical protein